MGRAPVGPFKAWPFVFYEARDAQNDHMAAFSMRQIFSFLNRSHDLVTTGGFLLAQFCLFVIVFAYGYETVARYFFAAPTSWSNEIVAYALCIGTFLAFPEVSRRGGHIAITFLIEYMRPGVARWAHVIIGLLSAAVCLMVAWICLTANLQQIAREEMLVRVSPIPKVWISVFLTYGFLSSGLFFLRLAIGRAFGQGDALDETQEKVSL